MGWFPYLDSRWTVIDQWCERSSKNNQNGQGHTIGETQVARGKYEKKTLGLPCLHTATGLQDGFFSVWQPFFGLNQNWSVN